MKENKKYFNNVYYLILGKQSLKIGDVTMGGIFYTDNGWYELKMLIEAEEEKILSNIIIKDSANKEYNIEEFLKIIKPLQIEEN